MAAFENEFIRQVGIKYPVICGAMYPCSNPELIAAVSEAGGVGIIQPISMSYVHGHELRAGIQFMRTLTSKPLGFNAIVEKSSKIYEDRMKKWIDIALEENVRFFVTALGNPKWVVDQVHSVGGIVYHDITERKWADKALEANVDGFVCVNNRAGGHLGNLSPEELVETMKDIGKPLICAGGIGDSTGLKKALDMGYQGVQLGTRFIATEECKAHPTYKEAIVKARAEDIVATDKISGVPVSIIKTPYIEKTGTRAGWLARKLLKGRKTKHYVRMFYTLQSLWKLKRSSLTGAGYKDFWQAGKSVDGISEIQPAGQVVRDLVKEIS